MAATSAPTITPLNPIATIALVESCYALGLSTSFTAYGWWHDGEGNPIFLNDRGCPATPTRKGWVLHLGGEGTCLAMPEDGELTPISVAITKSE